MTLMAKAAQGVTWHAVDTVHDARFAVCGVEIDLERQMHHSLVADHLVCQQSACAPSTTAVPA